MMLRALYPMLLLRMAVKLASPEEGFYYVFEIYGVVLGVCGVFGCILGVECQATAEGYLYPQFPGILVDMVEGGILPDGVEYIQFGVGLCLRLGDAHAYVEQVVGARGRA